MWALAASAAPEKKAVAREERDEDALKDGLDAAFASPKTLTGSWCSGLVCKSLRGREELGGPSCTVANRAGLTEAHRGLAATGSPPVALARSVAPAQVVHDSTAQHSRRGLVAGTR